MRFDGKVSIGRYHPFSDEVLECLTLRHADDQADSLPHALSVKGIGEIPVVQQRLHLVIRSRKPQLASAQSELQTTADAEIIIVIADVHLDRAMLASHEDGCDLHIIPQMRPLDRVAQAAGYPPDHSHVGGSGLPRPHPRTGYTDRC